MPQALDLTGQRFGKLVAIQRAPNRSGKTYWLCKCDCGAIKEIQTTHLRNGKTVSCGCLRAVPKENEFCLNCGIPLNKYQKKYCSLKCQQDYQNKDYLEKWKKGEKSGLKKSGNSSKMSDIVRDYLLKKTDYKCQRCGWGEKNPITGKVPLEIHHIDGNRMNNNEENLEVLCPNCHSLTPNYKYLNSKKFKEK